MPDIDPGVLVLLAPILLLQLGLAVFALVDLFKPERRVRGGSKAIWAIVIVVVNLAGPIVYFLAGRDDRPVQPAHPAAPPGPGAITGWQAPDGEATAATVITEHPQAAGSAGTAQRSTAHPATAPLATAHPAAPRAAAPPAAAPDKPVPPWPGADSSRQSDPSHAAIVVDGLSKRYPGPEGGVLALDRLDLAVPSGSVFGLLGPNGAGKSTCLRLLVGLTRPTGGTATVAGHRLPEEALDVRRRLGFLEQDPRAYGWMTGREQLVLAAELHGMRGRALAEAVTGALERVGIASAADRRIGTYSGGMRQRLGIAAALVHRPSVIILDEPVSSLDPEGRRDVLNLIHDLRGSTTVLFSTHVLADVERICDRVGILDRGRLVVEGPLESLLDRYALPVYRLEAEPGQTRELETLAERLRTLPWVTETRAEHGLLTVAVADPATAGRELLGEVVASGIAIISLARARPTLEDVFLQLTGTNGRVAA
jgi:ABC-2 type transport system ATP-binding protein